MKLKYILAAMLLSFFSFGVVHAAGSPINEDFSALIAQAEKMIDAGKKSDATAFIAAADEGSSVAKDQGNKGNSPGLQRVSFKFKMAKKAVKAGDFIQGITLSEEAITEMKKEKAPLKFGGGS